MARNGRDLSESHRELARLVHPVLAPSTDFYVAANDEQALLDRGGQLTVHDRTVWF